MTRIASIFAIIITLTVTAFADDAEDVIFLAPGRPVFLRIRVLVDGKSHREPWRAYLRDVFAKRDANGDGVLSGEEAKQLPKPEQLRSAESEPRSRGDWEPDGNKDGQVTFDEFATACDQWSGPALAVRMTGAGTLTQLETAQVQPDNQAAQRVFRQLDKDRNNKLTVEELDRVLASVRKLDRDDDDSISLQEINPANPFVYSGNPEALRTRAPVPFVALSRDDVGGKVVRKFVQQYDRRSAEASPDLQLSKDELPIAPATFDAHDKNADGQLDYDEVLELLRSAAPQIECTFYLSDKWERTPPIDVARLDMQLPVELRKGAAGEITIVLEFAQIELSLPFANQFDAVMFLEQQLKASDGDNNGYVERKEAQQNYYVNQAYSAADSDGDGKLFAEEYRTYLDTRQRSARNRSVLELVDTGRNLFEILDVNRDRRLGEAELLSLRERRAAWDADQDGALGETEVPQHYRLTVRRGTPSIPGMNFIVPAQAGVGAVVTRSAGPQWFRKMDRNSDGEVSRREFVGPSDLFDRLDDNDDNRLLPGEADGK